MQEYVDMSLTVPQTVWGVTQYLVMFAQFVKLLPAGQLPVRLHSYIVM